MTAAKACLWIHSTETFSGQTILCNIRLNDETWFGGTDGAREVTGTFLLCGDRIRQIVEATLSLIHIQGRGNLVEVDTNAVLPDTPFLLTDNLELKRVFDGPALLRDVRRDNAVIYCGTGISIVTSDWFGFAFTADDWTRLVAFSEHPVKHVTTTSAYAPCWEVAPEQSIEVPISIEMTSV
jgi:hypothetical protein